MEKKVEEVKKAEIEIIWKEPVQLGGLEGKENFLSEELAPLQALGFVILKGPAGTGKTMNAMLYGKLHDMDVFMQECSSDMTLYDLIGSYIIKNGDVVFNAGVVTSALKNSQNRSTLLILDEINLLPPAVLKSVGSVLDFRKSVETPIGRVEGDKIKIVGTMNSESDSAGYVLDPALESRALTVSINIKDYINRLISGNVIDKETGKIFIETNFKFGFRELEQLEALASIMEKMKALEFVVNKYDSETSKLVKQVFTSIFGTEMGVEKNGK